jgi:putative endonuclease
MSYYVYLIATNRKKKIISYVGYAKEVKKRIFLHNNSKGAKFTKGNNWQLLYKKKYSTKSIAMSEEHKLKKNYKLRKLFKKRYNRFK